MLLYKKSAQLTTAEGCTQLINLWLTALYGVFDRVAADRQTAAIDLNAYRHKRSCHDLIILQLSAYRCAYHGYSGTLQCNCNVPLKMKEAIYLKHNIKCYIYIY